MTSTFAFRFCCSGMLFLSCLAAQPTRAADPVPAAGSELAPSVQRLEITGVHNAFRVTDRIYSGSQPEGDEAFAALARLGVKTIISVDGSKPEVERARRHGIRYVHLPVGYDGVSKPCVAALAKAGTTLSGPIFVHCHHGLHRGPAAVAVLAEATASWSTHQAVAWMRQAGTSPDYAGLYRCAASFTAPTAAELSAVGDLPEVARTSSLVEAMVAIDNHFAALKAMEKLGWKTPPQHADLTPAHEATLLWEQFRELARTPDTAQRPAEYRGKMEATEKAASRLRRCLEEGNNGKTAAAFQELAQSCSSCHRHYRNE